MKLTAVRNFIFPSLLTGILITPSCNNRMDRQNQAGYEPRPNIIFLLTDDQRDNSLGAMGHSFVRTPNLDRLVNQGIRFANTYIAAPVCAPSRVSLFTGMHERIHGVGFSSSYQLSEGQWAQTYPALLRENGYYTGFVGKFGVEYYTFKGSTPEKFDFWRAHDGWTRFFPKEFDNPACTPYHDAGEDIITYITGESMERFFDSAPSDRPFCLSVSFNVPHGSQIRSMYTGYEDWHKLTRPANENPKLKGHPYYDTLYRDTPFLLPDDCCKDPYRFIPKNVLDQGRGRANSTYIYNYDPQTCHEHHIRYYQTISGLDHVIGEMMKSLEERGLAENTVIIYGSDHGLLMGEYGMGGKELLYDLVMKIPCFVYDPRLPEELRGRKLENLVSSLDITSTILDYAGIKQPEIMEGSSLVPLVYGKKVPWREELFLESLFAMRGNPLIEGVRKGNWKYIRMYAWGKTYTEADLDFTGRQPDFEQMFNLEEDPTEHRNLIAEYEGTDLLNELREKCTAYSITMNQEREAYKENHEIVPKQIGKNP
jgi:arylsulfatase A-like enzyme